MMSPCACAEAMALVSAWLGVLVVQLLLETFAPCCDGIIQGLDVQGRGTHPVSVEELQSHQLCLPVQPGHAEGIVAHRADGAGDVGAVAVVVKGVVSVVDEVPAEEVVGMGRVPIAGAAALPAALRDGPQQVAGVDAAVAIVVVEQAGVDRAVEIVEREQAIAVHVLDVGLVDDAAEVRAGQPGVRDLGLVDPDIRVQIRVVVVDAGVRDRHDDGPAARRHVPGLRGANVSAGVAPVLPRVQ